MKLTATQLARISENPDPVAFDLAGDIRALSPEMEKAGINTPARMAAFLANVCQETDRLKTLEEYGNEAYFRSFLGDQWRYHGRGYLMNTWKAAYRNLSRVLGVDLVAQPDRLSKDKALAAKAACWFWSSQNLNQAADEGNFEAVCSLINRGEYPPRGPIKGYEARRYFHGRALEVLAGRPQPEKDIVLRSGLGKDGSGAYVQQHPTNYRWRMDVGRVARNLVNLPRFYKKIWANTYDWHPPYDPPNITKRYDTLSFDVWGFGGRGDPIGTVGHEVFDVLFSDPNKPDIAWVIWNRRMWIRGHGWMSSPPGFPGSDAEHVNHIHVTYL